MYSNEKVLKQESFSSTEHFIVSEMSFVKVKKHCVEISEENEREYKCGLLGADGTEVGVSCSAFFTKIHFLFCGCLI